MVVFGLWYIRLLTAYKKAFREAKELAARFAAAGAGAEIGVP